MRTAAPLEEEATVPSGHPCSDNKKQHARYQQHARCGPPATHNEPSALSRYVMLLTAFAYQPPERLCWLQPSMLARTGLPPSRRLSSQTAAGEKNHTWTMLSGPCTYYLRQAQWRRLVPVPGGHCLPSRSAGRPVAVCSHERGNALRSLPPQVHPAPTPTHHPPHAMSASAAVAAAAATVSKRGLLPRPCAIGTASGWWWL